MVYGGTPIKEFRVIGNLTIASTRMILAKLNITKKSYSFKSDIRRGAGLIKYYSKTLTSPPGMLTGLVEIQAYIKECEQKW